MTSGVAMVRSSGKSRRSCSIRDALFKNIWHPLPNNKQHIMGGLHEEKENADYIDYLLIR